ncbi:hypothetical protein HDU79_011117 [Rhizoclosmatium sp. JEL0117]|nr:hypothetical protein HDU79_011117 [Rhizoclosmatium sp. JEL0117]
MVVSSTYLSFTESTVEKLLSFETVEPGHDDHFGNEFCASHEASFGRNGTAKKLTAAEIVFITKYVDTDMGAAQVEEQMRIQGITQRQLAPRVVESGSSTRYCKEKVIATVPICNSCN